jgi:nucleoside-diphosphate-sugar epimerase
MMHSPRNGRANGERPRIVVTGAAGFLGSRLVLAAEAAGYDVLRVTREAGPGSVSMAALLASPAQLDGAELVVHTAAIRHRHGTDPSAYRGSNVDLVEALARASAGRVARFVDVSSVGVYGFPFDLPVTERHRYAPRTLYSETKVEAERLIGKLCPTLGLRYTILRPTIFYGPGDRHGMLDKLVAMVRARRYLLVGHGDNTLHHTHVDDVARAVLELGCAEAARDEHFIVAGPETVTLARLGELVARELGRRIPPVRVPLWFARSIATCIDIAAYRGVAFREREPPINHEKLDVMTRDIAFDVAKARAAGFVPRIDYEEGIRSTLRG